VHVCAELVKKNLATFKFSAIQRRFLVSVLITISVKAFIES